MQADEYADEQLLEQANRLDALLSRSASPSTADDPIVPLLHTAESLARMGQAQVNPSYADNLEVTLMREVAAMTATTTISQHEASTLADIPRVGIASNGARPTPTRTVNTQADSIPPSHPRQRRWDASRRRRFLWQLAAAAAILVCITVPLSVAAAHAEPGSPLFALRRLEQGVQAGLTFDPASRARLQLGYARDSLTALEHAINDGDHSAYLAALSSFESVYKDARNAVADVSAPDQRAPIQDALDSLRTQASTVLYQALDGMNLADRLATTSTLGLLGNNVPQITLVTFARSSGSPASGDGLMINIHGSGFVSGAIVLINGRPSGEVRKVASDEIQVVIAGVAALDTGTTVGVENPDGTVATAAVSAHGKPTQPGDPTKTPNNHADPHSTEGTNSQG